MSRHLVNFVLLGGLLLAAAAAADLLQIRLYDRIVTHMMISAILVIGLQMFMGNSGILSFAHVGFMGVGAYTAAVLSIPEQMKSMALPDLYSVLAGVELSPLLAIPAGALVAALVAAVISFPLMRLSDAAAVITSFALLVVLHTVLTHWSAVTNGPRTLFGIPKSTTLWMATGCALGALVLALLFKESRTGQLLRASRDDHVAAAALGADIPYLRWIGFVAAALLAGLGGALWGHFVTSFSPRAFYLKETFLVLSMLVIGGPNTVTGAVLGTLIVTTVYESLRTVEGALNESGIFSGQVIGLTEIVLALAMIAVLALRPGGLFPTREIGTLLLRRRQNVPDAETGQQRGEST